MESFRNAAECIGPVSAGMALFAVTRGQFSMIDALLHVLDEVGPARVSVWTWCIAEYEVQCFDRLRMDQRVTDGLLVIDGGARKKNGASIRQWRDRYGESSVRYTVNHAKIATVEGGGLRLLLRGSMNLNHNPRFEQLDISEGCGGFDLVRRIESELPILADDCSTPETWASARIHNAFSASELQPFAGVRTWAK